MKIGFDAKRAFHNSTGLGNYSRDLVRILSLLYSQNRYVLYNPKPKKIDRLELSEKVVEVLPKKKIWKKLSSIWRQGPIVDQLLEDTIDIFHGLSGEIPKGLNKTNILSVVTIHDLIFVRYPKLYSFFDRKIHFKKFKHAAENATVIIAISEQTKKDIVDFLKIDSKKIDVIYQGCHAVFKEYQTEEFKNSVLTTFNLPKEFVLNVGTIETRKNLMILVKVLKDIEYPLVVVGKKTAYFKEIEGYILQNNLQHKIHFLEGVSLSELAALYKIATIFIYPSFFEGFGIPIIEALYSKTPVITSTGSCFSEAGGLNSIYIDPNNAEALKVAIQELLKSKEKQQDMIDEGILFVQKFNDDVIAKKYMDVYLKLMTDTL